MDERILIDELISATNLPEPQVRGLLNRILTDINIEPQTATLDDIRRAVEKYLLDVFMHQLATGDHSLVGN